MKSKCDKLRPVYLQSGTPRLESEYPVKSQAIIQKLHDLEVALPASFLTSPVKCGCSTSIWGGSGEHRNKKL